MGDKNITKFYLDWDESEEKGMVLTDKLDEYFKEFNIYENDELIIGAWENPYEKSSSTVVEYFINNKEKFPNLKKLYWGEMESEECEISWIINDDLAPLVNNFKLEDFTAQGGTDLRFINMKSDTLKSLTVVSGGTSKETLKDISDSDLPNLEKLVIYLGVDDYGFDAKIDDLVPFTKKEKFPKLKYLGLVNSDIENEICDLVLESDILSQLEVLDLSLGSLDKDGVKKLLENTSKLEHLKELNISHNYASKELLEKLDEEMKNLGVKVIDDIEPYDDEDDDYKFPYITE